VKALSQKPVLPLIFSGKYSIFTIQAFTHFFKKEAAGIAKANQAYHLQKTPKIRGFFVSTAYFPARWPAGLKLMRTLLKKKLDIF